MDVGRILFWKRTRPTPRKKSTRAFRLRPGPPTPQRPGASAHTFGNQPPEAGAAARKHRHGNTIPNPNGPPIVPFPRKRAASSAAGGALVLSPLEIPPKERRGSNSGKRSRGRPICNTCVRRTFWCGGRTILRFEYSAAGRGVSSLVGSAWRPTSVWGELTDKAVNSSLTFFFSTVHGAFSF